MADQIMLGKSRGDLPEFTCHCGPQMVKGKITYLTFNEDEASGRVPVQTSSVGDYPGPADMGIDIIATNDCTTTYQRTADGIHMSG
jgi:hypothetical protein